MTTPKEAERSCRRRTGHVRRCQALVKAMFNDHAFRDGVDLSGVNSINWARIVAQVTYYFYAASRLGGRGRCRLLCRPEISATSSPAFAAKRMGLAIDKLIIASNDNDILPRAVATGTYVMKDVVSTSSPSMDIQISSNFERYLFEASGRDVDLICSSMASLIATGHFELGRLWPRLQNDFAAASASEDDVAACIKATKGRYGYVLDPHTACAVVAAERIGSTGEMIVLATAHPAKFPDAIEAITGTRPGLPNRLAQLMTDPERVETLPNSLSAVQDFVLKHCRATSRAP